MINTRWIAAWFLLATLWPSAVARAQETILQGVQTTKRDNAFVVRIDFSLRMHYLRHFPFSGSDTLQIQLRPAQQDDFGDQIGTPSSGTPRANPRYTNTATRESMLPKGDQETPLVHVIYEGDVPGGPYLTLKFKYHVDYAVVEGPTATYIEVRVVPSKGNLSLKANKDVTLGSDKALDALMANALKALAQDNYVRAIVLFENILERPTNAYTRGAKELVGIARERKGDIDRAKLEYLEYLRLYPDSPGAKRVNQRLSELMMKQVPTQAEPAPSPETAATGAPNLYGRFSQRYFADSARYDTTRTTINLASFTSSINMSTRYNYGQYDFSGFADVQYINTLHGASTTPLNTNALYAEISNRDGGNTLSVGRRDSSRSGVVGRFDGVLATIPWTSGYAVNFAFGRPSESLIEDVEMNRKFASVSLTTGSYTGSIRSTTYFISQYVNNIIDRQAIGGDARYSADRFSCSINYDYDVSYSLLNILTLNGGWNIDDQTHIDLTYDRRLSPTLQTVNAIQQEGLITFNELLDVWPASEIRQKAAELSIDSRRGTISISHRIDEDRRLFLDFTIVSSERRKQVQLLLEPIVPTDPTYIEAIDAYGPEYFYAGQYAMNNVMTRNDTHYIGVRLSTSPQHNTQQIYLRSQFPASERWHIGPRMQVDRAQSVIDDNIDLRPTVAIKADYRWTNKISFESDISYEVNMHSGGAVDNDYSRLVGYIAYNVDF